LVLGDAAIERTARGIVIFGMRLALANDAWHCQ